MNDNIGIFPGVPFEEYAKIDAVNGSGLVHLRRSPMYYRYMADHPQAPTETMILGTATHQLILEPHRVGDFAVWGELPEHRTDGGRMRPRNGKDWDAFQKANEGKLIVTADTRNAMVGMAVGARRHTPIMRYANAKGDTEVVLVWRDPTTGRLMKGRVDKLIGDGKTVFDLKTTASCNKYKFGNQAYKLGYHIKMAIYWLGVKALTGHLPKLVLGAVENSAPYESATFRITSDALLQGLEDLEALLQRLAACEESGEWPAAEPDELELTLPTYAYGDKSEDNDLSDLALVESE